MTVSSIMPKGKGWAHDVLALALVFAGALVFFSQVSNFPFYGHADEPGKAQQVLTGKRNFNHPVLMLNSAALVNGVTGNRDDYNRATMTGRWVVASYAAGAVALLSWLAAQLMVGEVRGLRWWLFLIVTGVVIASTPQLFEFSHYFKEDPVLVFGLAAFLVAAYGFERKPSYGTLLALIVGMALAASGKYLGAAVVPLGCWLAWRVGRGAWWPYRVPPALVALVGFLLIFFLINYQGIRGVTNLADSIVEETQKSLNRPDGIDRSIPNSMGWYLMVQTTTGPVWLGLAAALVGFAVSWRRLRAVEVFLILLPLFFGLSVCFTDKMSPRYFLPVSTLVSCLAAIGLYRIAAWGSHRQMAAVQMAVFSVFLVTGAGLVVQSRLPKIQEVWTSHEGDPRLDLALYIRDHLPTSARIVSDKRVRLPNAEQPENDVYRLALKQEVLLADDSQFAADYAPFDQLKSRGITHVAIAEPDWGRYFIDDGRQPIVTTDPEVLARIAFYTQLMKQGRLVWESPAKPINIVWPGLRLYELP